MDHIIRRARNSGDPIQIVKRINTVAGIIFHAHSHVDHMEVFRKLSRPSTISMGIDTLDHWLAILTAKDKSSGIHFELGDVHINLPYQL
jgi:hypothetical protein